MLPWIPRFGALAGALVSASLAACSGGGEEPRSVLLVTLDTTRADVLSCYGGPPGLTPRIDALAAGGTLYEQARTVCPLTLPSHVSMLTGLYPVRHRVRDNSAGLATQGAPTLAELAAGAGLRTAAFVASVVLDGATGIARGFDLYVQPRGDRETAMSMLQMSASEQVGNALAWADELGAEDEFFLWVHFYDPHAPYSPPLEHRVRVQGPSERARYCGEVSYVDSAIGDLVDGLERMGRLDDTLVVVVGDHGEALGDHGERTHGAYVYDTTMRVPLVVSDPRSTATGVRRTDVVSVVDVYPTLVTAFGLDPVPGIDGVDLFAENRDPDRGVHFESYMGYREFGWSPLVGVMTADAKYIHSPTPELFDARTDPNEQRDVAAERADDVARARALIAELSARPRLVAATAPDRAARALQLNALGYGGDAVGEWKAPEPLEPVGLPSPPAQRSELVRFENALTRYRDGDHAGAAPEFEAIVAANPGHRAARFQAALCRMRASDHAGARALLAPLVEVDPDNVTILVNLAICERAVGRGAAAEALFRQALELAPGHPKATLELNDLLESDL